MPRRQLPSVSPPSPRSIINVFFHHSGDDDADEDDAIPMCVTTVAARIMYSSSNALNAAPDLQSTLLLLKRSRVCAAIKLAMVTIPECYTFEFCRSGFIYCKPWVDLSTAVQAYS